jgi:CxxC motif-containing protein (DUF1111 family)
VKKFKIILFFLGISFLLMMCRKAELFPLSDDNSQLSGGAETVFDNTSHAFSNPFPLLSGYNLRVHELGDQIFEATFVTAPAPVHSGLGPLFNNVGCASCHHNDGIGLPTAGAPQSSLLMRISMQGTDEHGGPMPVPGYGTQLQDKATFGKQRECSVNISYTYQTFSFPDGVTYELRTPTYTLNNLYTPIDGNYFLSPRLAPPVFGLGLLEAIPEAEIVANADPNDANGDGIKGIPNYVWDPVSRSIQLGRFGLKANTASILVQVATAFNQDMGVTSSLLPVENSFGQPQYDNLKDDPELQDSVLNEVKFYVQTLAVPARRNVTDTEVLRGEKFFTEAKCTSCHIPTMTTGVNVAFPEASNQVIHPYSDLLLHDMGPGLADNRPDFLASGQQWRTAPLWGIGLFSTVNYPAYYLHDGRARTLIEAIMWHGGEAQQSKEFVQQLSTTDRNDLLKFLESL